MIRITFSRLLDAAAIAAILAMLACMCTPCPAGVILEPGVEEVSVLKRVTIKGVEKRGVSANVSRGFGSFIYPHMRGYSRHFRYRYRAKRTR